MLVRATWLKNSVGLEAFNRKGRTSLVEDDLAEVLEKYGYITYERPPQKEKPPKVKKAVVKETRTR